MAGFLTCLHMSRLPAVSLRGEGSGSDVSAAYAPALCVGLRLTAAGTVPDFHRVPYCGNHLNLIGFG